MNAHEEALRAVVNSLNPNDSITEISYVTPFGFAEINRTNVTVETFLAPTYTERSTVSILHVLLGCGVPLEQMTQVVNKALTLSDRILILDHNRASTDWDWTNQDLIEDHCLENCITYNDMWNLCDLFGWSVCRDALIPGEKPDRNMLFELLGGIPGWNPQDKYEMVRALRIPIFSSDRSPKNYRHPYDVYAGTAESTQILFSSSRDITGQIDVSSVSVHARKEFQKDIVPTLSIQPYTLYACGGGFFSLDHIHMLRNTLIKEIKFFDVSPYTIDFLTTIMGMIFRYPTRMEFLRNYLLTNIDISGDPQLLNTTFSDRIKLYLANCSLYSEQGQFMAKLLLNGDVLSKKLRVYGLRNCADNRTDQPGYLELTHEGDRYIEENALRVGQEGWLESDKTYEETREFLNNIPHTSLVKSLDDITPESEDLILASNIYTNANSIKRTMPCRIIHHGNIQES